MSKNMTCLLLEMVNLIRNILFFCTVFLLMVLQSAVHSQDLKLLPTGFQAQSETQKWLNLSTLSSSKD